MKFMIKVVIKNLTNNKLINKLTKIINNKELKIKNILNTVNTEIIIIYFLKLSKTLHQSIKQSMNYTNMLKKINIQLRQKAK